MGMSRFWEIWKWQFLESDIEDIVNQSRTETWVTKRVHKWECESNLLLGKGMLGGVRNIKSLNHYHPLFSNHKSFVVRIKPVVSSVFARLLV